MSSSQDTARPLGFYGRHRHFLRLNYEILDHPRFLALKATEQMVLIAWIRAYNDLSNHDRNFAIAKTGFPFPPSACPLKLSRNTFYRCMTKLEEEGFIKRTAAPSSIDKRVDYWKPCYDWSDELVKPAEPGDQTYLAQARNGQQHEGNGAEHVGAIAAKVAQAKQRSRS